MTLTLLLLIISFLIFCYVAFKSRSVGVALGLAFYVAAALFGGVRL